MIYKQLNVDVKLRAEHLTCLLYLVEKERSRIFRESPDAFNVPGSWACSIDQIHSQLIFANDSNLK